MWLFFSWSAQCIVVIKTVDNQQLTFAITDTKPDVPFATSSARDNGKLF